MDDGIPIVVKMRVERPRCGHAEDETYELDMPHDNVRPIEADERGKCPECGAYSDAPEAHAAGTVEKNDLLRV